MNLCFTIKKKLWDFDLLLNCLKKNPYGQHLVSISRWIINGKDMVLFHKIRYYIETYETMINLSLIYLTLLPEPM